MSSPTAPHEPVDHTGSTGDGLIDEPTARDAESGEGAPDVPADAGSEPGEPPSRSTHPLLLPVLLAVLVGAMAAVMLATHRSGHWWGDDWALYLRQAQSLIDGNPGEVTADNEFTVDNSIGGAFSPALYPWGFPLILAPFVAVVGIDIDALHIVPVLSSAVFACAWFAIARRRVGTVAAYVSTAAVTLTPVLLSWSELLQSEWPFLALTFSLLIAVDRAIDSRVLVDTSARWWPVIALGVGAAAAFSIRREGLAMTAAIGGAQLALLSTGTPNVIDMFRDHKLTARLITPYLSALATVWALQVVLPSTLVPRYSGTSLSNMWGHGLKHVRHLADICGFKRQWEDDPSVLGSTGLGWAAVIAYLLLAAVGMGLALFVHRRRDLHLVAYALSAFVIGVSPRAALSRYLATVGPVLVLLGLVALVTLPGRRRVRWGRAIATIAAGAIVWGNVANANVQLDRAERAAAIGAIEWGPTHPDAVAMFEVVRTNTDPDEVVAGPKARALTLMTDRRSIQIDRWRALPETWSPSLVVTEADTLPEERLREVPDRYVELWSNARFVIFVAIAGPYEPPG